MERLSDTTRIRLPTWPDMVRRRQPIELVRRTIDKEPHHDDSRFDERMVILSGISPMDLLCQTHLLHEMLSRSMTLRLNDNREQDNRWFILFDRIRS